MFRPSKEKWDKLIAQALGSNFVMVHSNSMQAIHIVAFIHIKLCPLLSGVSSKHIALGIKNVLGNKGAVALEFVLGTSKLLAISCHLEAG